MKKEQKVAKLLNFLNITDLPGFIEMHVSRYVIFVQLIA